MASEYKLAGGGFDTIPAGSIGIVSGVNNNPLQNLHDLTENRIYDISEISDNSAVLVQRVAYQYGSTTYLGASVSPDRQTIYWINDTKPLP